MSRRHDRTGVDWQTPSLNFQWEHVSVELLMDLRDELRVISRKLKALERGNFIRIPHLLTGIENNTRKPKRKAKPNKPPTVATP